MSQNTRAVTIGSLVVSDQPDDVLVAYGLGSCIALCLYDPVKHVGGMLHALLPNVPNGRHPENVAKFVDLGTEELVRVLANRGSPLHRLVIHLCGGAKMLIIPGDEGLPIGARNTQVAEATLAALGLKIHGRATGGDKGRTVRLYITTGLVTVSSLGSAEQAVGAKTPAHETGHSKEVWDE